MSNNQWKFDKGFPSPASRHFLIACYFVDVEESSFDIRALMNYPHHALLQFAHLLCKKSRAGVAFGRSSAST